MKKSFTYIFVFAFLVLFFSDTIMAIPAFARKYDMSCTTCHTPFPKLKAYGDEICR
ncbi:MAG: hypothetical protein U5K00_05575 [Melioribacteraceae bacterium]|nr:hypothetical protein [Melioribacteraceae bacterium]